MCVCLCVQPGLNGIPLLEQYETEFGQAQESVITYLISKGAQVNAVDIYGQTPLHFAAMRGNEVACKDLLNIPGVNIEVRPDWWTRGKKGETNLKEERLLAF